MVKGGFRIDSRWRETIGLDSKSTKPYLLTQKINKKLLSSGIDVAPALMEPVIITYLLFINRRDNGRLSHSTFVIISATEL